MLVIMYRYTTDSITSIAYGHNCKSLYDPNNDFKRYGSKVFDSNPLINALGFFAPIVLDVLGIPLTDPGVIKFFSQSFQQIVKYRRQNNIVRKDFLNLLMQLMDKGTLDDDEKSKMNNGSSGR